MHDFRLRVSHILDPERHRALDPVEVIIDAESLEHKKRGRDPVKPQLGRKVKLEEILDLFDGQLRLPLVKQGAVPPGFNQVAHLQSVLYMNFKYTQKPREEQIYLFCRGVNRIYVRQDKYRKSREQCKFTCNCRGVNRIYVRQDKY